MPTATVVFWGMKGRDFQLILYMLNLCLIFATFLISEVELSRLSDRYGSRTVEQNGVKQKNVGGRVQ